MRSGVAPRRAHRVQPSPRWWNWSANSSSAWRRWRSGSSSDRRCWCWSVEVDGCFCGQNERPRPPTRMGAPPAGRCISPPRHNCDSGLRQRHMRPWDRRVGAEAAGEAPDAVLRTELAHPSALVEKADEAAGLVGPVMLAFAVFAVAVLLAEVVLAVVLAVVLLQPDGRHGVAGPARSSATSATTANLPARRRDTVRTRIANLRALGWGWPSRRVQRGASTSNMPGPNVLASPRSASRIHCDRLPDHSYRRRT